MPTFQITKDNYYNPSGPLFGGKPVLAKLKGLNKKDRWYGEMRLTGAKNGAHTYTVFPFYKPSPKSTLKNKSKFSKNKFKLCQ